VNNRPNQERDRVTISDALRSLPMLGEDFYLQMQALNLGVVDDFLVDLESELLREYMELEKTPVPSAVFVSALSQLWIFGVYELLRTWRQRVREVLHFVEKLNMLGPSAQEAQIATQREKLQRTSPYPDGIDDLRWSFFEQAINDKDFLRRLQVAVDSSELVFRRIEALRIHLAKHEVPKAKGSSAMAPGYGRIDMVNGSIYYQVLLRGNEVDIISRRDIAESCRSLTRDRTPYMLPPKIREQLARIPEWGYGVKRVTVKLVDGSKFSDVFVAWDREVTSVGSHEKLPFEIADIVEVRSQSD
jgi:hypothetical protein